MIAQKLQAAAQLDRELTALDTEAWQSVLKVAELENKWFSQENIRAALQGIRRFLDQDQLIAWLDRYKEYTIPVEKPKKVGIVAAGNIPLVVFQDFWQGIISGHQLLIKLSTQDNVLLKKIAEILYRIDPEFKNQIQFVELLKEADAYIATGSNNSARYFEYYFSKKPHIIRKNRSSCGILHGNEPENELEALAKDIFMYFGLGCRNISKLYLPGNYNFERLRTTFSDWGHLMTHNKYGNNYDYNKAILLMNREPFYDLGFLILQENERLSSPVSTVYYEFYENSEDLHHKIQQNLDRIQLIASSEGWFPGSIPFGQSQNPVLWDYADGVDTFKFLLEL